ncbi:MAG: DDE-type integrase/transposase/recombinase [Chlorobi bacterium]|nr:DDE-type integrase/transposase/recombinase [Chlorobiota bacterium]
MSDYSLSDILKKLGLNRNKYNYLKKSLKTMNEPKPRKKSVRLQKPMPAEVEAVEKYVKINPGYGYKRYTYMLLDDNIVALKEYQVYEVLKNAKLLLFAKRQSGILKHPPKPTKADEIWHIDIMYLWIYDRWFYLVDIIDGYSRFLVHWKLCTTMHANTVVETMQEAIDQRKADEIKPHIVHDNGKQFLGSLWTDMIEYNKLTDIKIRVHHPQSNGTVERLHRTHREECFNKDIDSYAKAVDMMETWTLEYNYVRPHSSLNYLSPADYYYGNPKAKLKQRKEKIDLASEKRKQYWLSQKNNLRDAI